MKRAIFPLALLAALLLALPGALSARGDEIDEYIRGEMESRRIPGLALAVARDGEVIKATGYGKANVELDVPVTPETIFQIQSISKTFTAAAVLLLVEEEKVGLRDPIREHLDGLPESWSEVTVYHLLTHTSGIPDYINRRTVNLRLEATTEEIVRSLRDRPLEFEPGGRYSYSNTGYQLLGELILKVTEKTWDAFVGERILEPLEMRHTRRVSLGELIPNRASGYGLARNNELRNGNYVAESILGYPGGGLVSTVLDLAKWDAGLRTEKLLKRETLEQIFTPGELNNGRATSYGFGWVIGRDGDRRYVQHTGSHTTGFTAVIRRYLDDGLAVIICTNQRSGAPASMVPRIAAHYLGGS